VVLAVVGDPGDHRALDRHRPEHGDDRAKRPRRFERAVGEHAVVAERHAKRREHIEHHEQSEFERPDSVVPEQRDRSQQAHQREGHTDQVDDLVGAGHGSRIGTRERNFLVPLQR
jgi:hypothetical protein